MKQKTKGFTTINREIFLLAFIFLILVSILFANIFLNIIYNKNIESAKNSLRQCNSQIVTYTDGLFGESATLVEILSQNDTIINAGNGDKSSVIEIFERIRNVNSNITYIYSSYADGSLLINNYDAPPNYDPRQRPWYISAAASDSVVQLVYTDAATGVWLFSQCKKLVDENGNMVGTISIDSSSENISHLLITKYQYDSQRSFIIDKEGTVLIHPETEEINQSLKADLEPSVWQSISSRKSNYVEYYNHNVKTIAYLEFIPDTDFIVATAISASEITKPIFDSIFSLILLIAGISVVLSLILSRILIHRFGYPIMELRNRIQSIALGKASPARKTSFSNAEINSIAESIEVIVKDIAKHEKERKAAEYLSFHDFMTGLYNRRFFDEELKRLDTSRHYPLCLICCDVNGLKLVNDVFGHAVGDKLITTIAECLQKECRESDILARVGGDEFVIILPNTSESEAQQVMLRLKSGFPKDSIYGAEVSASLGFSVKTDKSQSIDDVLKAADEMMYNEKLMESTEMKLNTLSNIIEVAQTEGLITDLSDEENFILDEFSNKLCPDSKELLKDSYCIRKIGLCTLAHSPEHNFASLEKRHTEIGYRILSSLEDYRGVAVCILHYTEHWDGSGWPAGLSGRDIPLPSRIIAVVEGYINNKAIEEANEKSGSWYDPYIVNALIEILQNL